MSDNDKLPRGVFEKEPGSGIYWIRYADVTGRIKRQLIGPKLHLAVSTYHKRKQEVREGKIQPENLRARVILFEELAKDFLEYSRVRHTAQSHEKNIQRMEVLLAHFRGKSAVAVKAQDIMRVLGANPDWMPATRNRYRALLSGLYSLGIRNDKIEINPAKKVRLWKENNARVRFIEPKEEERLRAQIRKLAPKHEPEFDLALATGMRRGEQFKLKWSAIDWKRKILTVENSKNGEKRHIPITDQAHDALTKLRAQGDKRPWVVPGPLATAEREIDSRRWFESAVRAAKISNFHWHDLRHTFASRHVMNGTDIRTVQELMGHKTIGMTVRYSHLSAPHKKDAMKKLDRYWKPLATQKKATNTTTNTEASTGTDAQDRANTQAP